MTKLFKQSLPVWRLHSSFTLSGINSSSSLSLQTTVITFQHPQCSMISFPLGMVNLCMGKDFIDLNTNSNYYAEDDGS